MDFEYIEELLKSKDVESLVKNKKLVDHFIQNARMLRNPSASEHERGAALANIKMLNETRGVGVSPTDLFTPESFKASQDKQALKAAKTQSSVAPAQGMIVKPKFSPIYQEHYNLSKDMWNQLNPTEQNDMFQHHNNVMAGKIPELAHIKTAIESKRNKVLKSIEDQIEKLYKALES